MTAERLASLLARHFKDTFAALHGVAVALGAGPAHLACDTSQNGLIGSQSQVAKDNVRYQAPFGGDAMLITVTGRIENLFTPTNLARQWRLEGQLRANGNCASVVGPVDTLQFAADQLKVGPEIVVDAINRGDHAAASASPRRAPVGVT